MLTYVHVRPLMRFLEGEKVQVTVPHHSPWGRLPDQP